MNKNKKNIIIAVVSTFVITALLFSLASCSFINFSLFSSSDPVKIDDKLTEINAFIDKYGIMPFDKEEALSNAILFYVASM